VAGHAIARALEAGDERRASRPAPARGCERIARCCRVGRALDVACGRGRNALWLARAGFRDHRDRPRRRGRGGARRRARGRGLPLAATAWTSKPARVRWRAAYDVVVVVHYLHRPLFPALLAALRPGGVLVYETFTRPRPRAAAHEPGVPAGAGRAARLVAGLEISTRAKGTSRADGGERGGGDGRPEGLQPTF
jgi:SAM-dependent methyltransferase